MEVVVTPHLVQLTFEAALLSFWRTAALRTFLRECYVSEAHLGSWASDETKRVFLTRTFAALQRSERGKAVLGKMAIALGEQSSFPDLRNWEDSESKIAAARQAVAELKNCIAKQREKITNEREIENAKEKARVERAAVQLNRLTLEKLSSRINDLSSKMGTAPGGYEFQEWFYDLLSFFEVENRRPYVTSGRQIDGSVTLDGTTYLVELKFTSSQAGAPDVDVFRGKVESKADNTMGIFVSMAGYSKTAIQEASGRKTTMMLLDASHIYLALSGGMIFSEIIKRVRRHASQTGESYLAVPAFGG